MMIYVDKSGKVLKEVVTTLERVGKDGKSLGPSSEESLPPKRPDSKTASRRASTKKAKKED